MTQKKILLSFCAAIGCGSGLMAGTVSNMFVAVTAPGAKTVDGTTFNATGHTAEVEIRALPGWRLLTPARQLLPAGRSGAWRVASALGEDAEGGDVCHPSSESVTNHVAPPALSATLADGGSFVYAAPRTGVSVELSGTASVMTQGVHVVHTTDHSCPGTTNDVVTGTVTTNRISPTAYAWSWTCGSTNGAASGASFSVLPFLSKGTYVATARVTASNVACSLCACSDIATTNLVVSELRVACPPYLGIDRTDAGAGLRTREGTASLVPAQASVTGVVWSCGGVCEHLDAAAWSCVYGTTNREVSSVSVNDQVLTASAGGVVAVTNFTVVKLDVEVDGVGEADEETEGAFLACTNSVAVGDGSVSVQIACTPADLPAPETVSIDVDGGELLEGGAPAKASYPANQISGLSFRLRGVAPSASLRAGTITVTHAGSGAKDRARFTAVELVSIEPGIAIAHLEQVITSDVGNGTRANRNFAMPISEVVGNERDPWQVISCLGVTMVATLAPSIPEEMLPVGSGLYGGEESSPVSLFKRYSPFNSCHKDEFRFWLGNVCLAPRTCLYVFDARVCMTVDAGFGNVSNSVLVGHSWGRFNGYDASITLIPDRLRPFLNREVGFWPIRSASNFDKLNGCNGELRYDTDAYGEHPVTADGSYRILSFSKLIAALDEIRFLDRAPHYYKLFEYNCTDYAIEQGEWVDVNSLSKGGVWPVTLHDWIMVHPGISEE